MLNKINEAYECVADGAALEALRKSEELLRAVFNAGPELTCVSTIFGEFVEANDAFCAACGLSRDEIIGRAGSAITLWVDLERRHEFLELLGRDGFVRGFEADMRHATGEVRRCLLSAHVIKASGAALVVTTGQDLSGAGQGV